MANDQHITEPQSAAALGEHLRALGAELAIARRNGLIHNPAYMADLALDLAGTEAAYVGAAVTEIATLRAALNGPLLG